MRDPHDVIHSLHITEKTAMLQQLQANESNPCVARCKLPKVVFLVDRHASKQEIASAVETLYREQGIKVTAVNTLRVKPKMKRRGKGRRGGTPLRKKAIVTLSEGDVLEIV